ncbi:glutathione S-transferase family protein [Thalassospira lucentensis]|uniref:glutathione S-transferase family protein n=1 Tax=Thalassospira lucentensis TaxID=168935 RepID=UPI003AA8218A
MYPHFRLVGHRLCPYVQRVAMVMAAHSIAHERIDISLDDKPEWLFDINPTGKVPVLVIDQRSVLFEAAAICEYLDDVTGKTLFPSDPYERGQHRSLVAVGEQVLALTATLIYQAATKDAVDATMHQITQRLEILTAYIEAKPAGGQSKLGMLDFVFATVFRPFPVLAIGLNRDLYAGLDSIKDWSNRLLAEDIVRDVVPPSYLIDMQKFIARKDAYLGRRLSMVPTRL